ncbi:MAG: S8 family serine peptidase [Verrucomicrobiota bacterium]
MRRRHFFIALGFAVTAWLGYRIADTAAPRENAKPKVVNEPAAPRRTVILDEPAPRFRSGERPTTYRRDDEAAEAGALSGQRVLIFKDQDALEAFLKRAGEGIRVMGRLDKLNALHVGFLNHDELAALLDGEEEESMVFPVDVPTPGNATAQAGALALNDGLLEWLGITQDNAKWGEGVRIAVLDTGVANSPAFLSSITSINLVALSGNAADQNGHGTAVASMIIGQNPLTPGVAPGSSIISVRIADDLGQSDSVKLAQGIVSAVDAGANLINISMGSFGDSALVRNAIQYAIDSGALIIAASGNNGVDQVTYPAANPGVIAVGAVDALGNHLAFSNSGTELAISAPGFGINAAWTNDQAASVSGTSFSSPIVTGAIAALMSRPGEKRLTPAQAWSLLSSYLNDSGDAGADVAVGAGMPDLGRALTGETRGVYDAAVASQRILPPSPGNPNGQIEVLVQNRGTETLVNTRVQITTSSGVVKSNITTLPAKGVTTVRIPISGKLVDGLQYGSQVTLSGGQNDSKPSNDKRVEVYVPPTRK